MTKNHSSLEELYKNHFQTLHEKFNWVLEKLQIDSLLIHSGEARVQFLDDRYNPFRANPLFNYWLPLQEHPHCYLWLKKGQTPELFYYLKDDFWHKTAQAPQGFWTPHFKIHLYSEEKTLKETLGSKLWEKTHIIGEMVDKYKGLGLETALINDQTLINELHYLRTFKTPYEFECLRRANRKAAYAHLKAEEAFYQGLSEFEIQMVYTKALHVKEFDHPYNHIVALNENASILHYTDGELRRHPVQKLKTFLIDAGCGYLGYAADITRTYAYSQQGEFYELLKRFESLQLEIIHQLKTGRLYTENHLDCHLKIAAVLKDFHLVKDMELQEMVDKRVTFAFFPHGLGHMLGLQVHDVGGYFKDEKGAKNKPPQDHPYLRCTSEVKESHVFTIEPGLYFIPMLLDELKKSPQASHINWTKIEGLIPYGGIRIEDDIIVHKETFENITRDAFTWALGKTEEDLLQLNVTP